MLNTAIIDNQNLFTEGFKLLLASLEQHKFNFLSLSVEEMILSESDDDLDLIFVELDMKLIEDLKLIRKLRRKKKDAKIILLSMFNNTKIVRESFQCGIDGYILKTSSKRDLITALDEILKGNTYMTPGLRLTPKIGHKPRAEVRQNLYDDQFQIKQKLTKREKEVLEHIVLAKSNIEIGELLFISEQTVGVHKKNIMRKLAVHNTVSLVRFAIDNNLA
jgi:DNA-binding NarL/FixJ family response regulator